MYMLVEKDAPDHYLAMKKFKVLPSDSRFEFLPGRDGFNKGLKFTTNDLAEHFKKKVDESGDVGSELEIRQVPDMI